MAKLKRLTEQEMLRHKKRFMKLNEYSFVNQEEDLLLDEADDDANAAPVDPNAAPVDPNAAPVDPNATPVDPNAAPVDPNAAPDATGEGESELPMEAEPELPMEDMSQMDIVPQENEVEIDVTDLTQKQDEINAKVDTMSSETANMMDMLSNLSNKLEDIIKKTNDDMVKIKDEIVTRNPTPVEVLQKRITVSDPFNQTPSDYWKKKEAEGHYKLSDDEDETYELKGSDIGGSASEIYKSFGVTDDEMNQSLATMFRF